MDRVADLRNIHDQRRLFILASGPSLAQVDLSGFSRRLVMGLNRSFLVYPHARYHCTMDQRLFDEYGEMLRATRCLFTFEGRPFGIQLRLLGAEGFSFDLEEGIYSGYTVSYFALQVAVYMGFKEIFFVGLDLKHTSGNTHFFGNDFHSVRHESTEFPKMRRMLAHGAEALRDTGVRVYNCSPDTTLECFPKASLEWALAL